MVIVPYNLTGGWIKFKLTYNQVQKFKKNMGGLHIISAGRSRWNTHISSIFNQREQQVTTENQPKDSNSIRAFISISLATALKKPAKTETHLHIYVGKRQLLSNLCTQRHLNAFISSFFETRPLQFVSVSGSLSFFTAQCPSE